MLQTLLQKRSNGYYYFRWTCPPAIRKVIGKREIIKSLRTTSKIQALARAGSLYMIIDKLKAMDAKLASAFKSHGLAFKSLVKSNDGEITREEQFKVLEEVCSTILPAYYGAMEELGASYKAPSLLEAKIKLKELNDRLLAHCEAATNYLGEYGDGQNIFDDMSGLVFKS